MEDEIMTDKTMKRDEAYAPFGIEKPHTMENARADVPVIENKSKLPVKPRKDLLPYEKLENLSELEKAIINLSEELSNLIDLREGIEQAFSKKQSDDEQGLNLVTKYYNSMQQKFTEINNRLTNEINYRSELEEKLRSANYSREVYLLEQELDSERAKISLFIDELQASTKEIFGKIGDKLIEMKSAEQLIREATLKFRADAAQCTQSEFEQLKASTEAQIRSIAENAKDYMEAVKKSYASFLASCEKENKELVKKIPCVKGKISVESWIIVAIGALGFASLFIRLVMG